MLRFATGSMKDYKWYNFLKYPLLSMLHNSIFFRSAQFKSLLSFLKASYHRDCVFILKQYAGKLYVWECPRNIILFYSWIYPDVPCITLSYIKPVSILFWLLLLFFHSPFCIFLSLYNIIFFFNIYNYCFSGVKKNCLQQHVDSDRNLSIPMIFKTLKYLFCIEIEDKQVM